METVILHPPELTHKSVMLEQVKRFAEEVLPAFPRAIHRNRQWPNLLDRANTFERYVGGAPQPAANRAVA
jgi:hypothetical protein